MKTVLICDDDRDILDMLSLMLGGKFNVVCEPQSLNVVGVAKLLKPDVILMDLWMPILTGDQAIKIIREDASIKDTYIIAMSASQNGSTISMEAGADLFISKPFSMKELIKHVNSSPTRS